MVTYLAKRFFQTIFVLLGVSLIVFVVMYKAGDPVRVMLPPTATQQELEAMRRQLGLDKPLIVQYAIFLKNAVHGNLGISYHHSLPVVQLILQRLPATLELSMTSMLFSLIFALPIGILAAVRPYSRLSQSLMVGSIFGISLPTFWIGIMGILIFGVWLGWLPPFGRGETVAIAGIKWSFLSVDGMKHLLMPAVTLGLYQLAMLIRLVRAEMRDVLQADYISVARAKGLSEVRVTFKHALRNALIPVVTIIGLQFGGLIAFSLVTETIFQWPGMGKLLIDSIAMVDRPVVVAYLMIIAVVFVVINLVVDITYTLIDPRIRMQ
jgi:peptide/nickel transport system permease protein